jgi:imidazoleglycerol-phosphate dehydratase
MRKADTKRETRETSVEVELVVDGSGMVEVETGVPFLDHMLEACARHGYFDLKIKASGDLDVDAHHTMEDVGLTLGRAIRTALGDRKAINRFGAALVPMDEALARVVIDISGRPFLAYDVKPETAVVGGVSARLFREFFQALVNSSGMTLHIALLQGEEVHHILEAVFKAFGRCLDQATQADPRSAGVPSTKGVLD